MNWSRWIFRSGIAVLILVAAVPAEARGPSPHLAMRQWQIAMHHRMHLNQMLLHSQAYQRLARAERQVLARERTFLNHPSLRHERQLVNALQHEGVAMNRFEHSHAFSHWLNSWAWGPWRPYAYATIVSFRPPLVVPLTPTHHRPHLTAYHGYVVAEVPLPGQEFFYWSPPVIMSELSFFYRPHHHHHHYQPIYAYNPFGMLLSMTVFAPSGETFYISANAL